MGNMKIIKTQSVKHSGFSALLIMAAMNMTACSTVRDVTDWVPGVDSNEEVKAKQEQEAQKAREKAREAYEDKAAFESVSLEASETDARISVSISQKYAADTQLNPEDIGIEVNAGVVTLSGSVNSDDSAVRAISLAKSTPGVSRVVSKLVVIQLRSK